MGELEVHNGERWGKVVLKSWAFQTIDRHHRNIHLHDRRKSDKLITFIISLLTGNICTAVFWLYGQKLFRCLIRCCLSPCVDLLHNIQFIMRLLQICILKEFLVLQWNLYIYDTWLCEASVHLLTWKWIHRCHMHGIHRWDDSLQHVLANLYIRCLLFTDVATGHFSFPWAQAYVTFGDHWSDLIIQIIKISRDFVFIQNSNHSFRVCYCFVYHIFLDTFISALLKAFFLQRFCFRCCWAFGFQFTVNIFCSFGGTFQL